MRAPYNAPPGMAVLEPSLHPAPEYAHRCTLRCADGSTCTASFREHKGLAAHQRMTAGGEHGSRCYLARMVFGNCCPICRTIFKTTANARIHTRSALARGNCYVDQTRTAKTHNFGPDKFYCPDPECESYGIKFKSINTLMEHITMHLLHELRSQLAHTAQDPLRQQATPEPIVSLPATWILDGNSLRSSWDASSDALRRSLHRLPARLQGLVR